MGVVNNRIDIDALEKSSGGGGGGGALVIEKIFTGTVTKGGSTAYTLENPYTDYSILICTNVNGVNAECGNPMIVDTFTTGTNNTNATGLSSGAVTALRLDAEDATKFYTPIGSGNVNLSVYGIK